MRTRRKGLRSARSRPATLKYVMNHNPKLQPRQGSSERWAEAGTENHQGRERMKICIPTMGASGLDDQISEHFGRAQSFTIIDTISGKVDVIVNNGEHVCGGGAPVERLRAARPDVVVCGGLGAGALRMLGSLGYKVYCGANGTVHDAVEMYMGGKLQEATVEGACQHHHH